MELSNNTPMEDHPQKGDQGGACNRTACQSTVDVNYFNHSTRKYYCESCAELINKHNPEAIIMYGHKLCTRFY